MHKRNYMDIEELLTRGISEVIVKEDLKKRMEKGEILRIKEGFDPSSADIHLGHMVGLRKLRQFQEMGHKVVLIVGDWTAQIGDPSGRSATRPVLTAEQVRANAQTYMEQFFTIVDKDKTEVKWQSEWYGNFNLSEVLKLAGKFTIAQFLQRDDFKKRYDANLPISVTEFIYPMLQAYDSVMVKADVEFGGNDQKFNLLVGRQLQEQMGQRPQNIVMTPLLVGTDGVHKMSKSLGNYIGVTESPEQIYGKVMSIPDSLTMNYFELITDVPQKDLDDMKKDLESGSVNPMTYKKDLAKNIITQLYDSAAADEGETYFKKTVQNKEIPDEIPDFDARNCANISQIMVNAGFAKSMGEARRLIQQGGVELAGEKVTDPAVSFKNGDLLKVGKRRYLKINL